MSDKFSHLLAGLREQMDHHESTASLTIPETWMQGRSSFGGLSSALAVEAAAHLADGRPLRSILVTFAGPVSAHAANLVVNPIRTGKSVSIFSTEIIQDHKPSVLVQSCFGVSRETKSVPYAGTFEGEVLNETALTPFVPQLMPSFLQMFDLSWTGGGIPASGTSIPRIGMWVRFKEEDRPEDRRARMIAICDVPPPAMMAYYNRPINASSLTWSLEFLVDPAEVSSRWFYLDYRLEAASGGYSQQAGRVFDENKQLVAISHQCMTYFE